MGRPLATDIDAQIDADAEAAAAHLPPLPPRIARRVADVMRTYRDEQSHGQVA